MPLSKNKAFARHDPSDYRPKRSHNPCYVPAVSTGSLTRPLVECLLLVFTDLWVKLGGGLAYLGLNRGKNVCTPHRQRDAATCLSLCLGSMGPDCPTAVVHDPLAIQNDKRSSTAESRRTAKIRLDALSRVHCRVSSPAAADRPP